MLNISSDYFLKINSNFIINAFIKETNLASKYAFEKAGFEFIAMKSHQNHRSFHFKKFLCK
jgi:hypothetical protein